MPPPVGRAVVSPLCELFPAPTRPIIRALPIPLADVFSRTLDAVCDPPAPPATSLPPPPATSAPTPTARPAPRFDPDRSIVIGDSQSEGLEGGGRVECKIEDHRGQRIDYFYDLIGRTPRLVRDRDLVVLQMGGNDISGGRSADAIIADYQRVVARVHELNPGATIVLSTIPVRGQWLDSRDDRSYARRAEATLNTVNTWLVEHSSEGYEVFDVNTIAADPANPRLQRRDFRRGDPADVHFNRYGYRQIGAAITARFFEP